MVRGGYCQQVMTFFFSFLVFNYIIARLKLQFQSGFPPYKKFGSTPDQDHILTCSFIFALFDLITVNTIITT